MIFWSGVVGVQTFEALNTRYLYALLNAPGIGQKSVQQLLQRLTFSPANLQELHSLIKEAGRSNHLIKVPTISELEQGLWKFDKLARDTEQAQVQIIGLNDSEFPEALKQIPDPPFILYVKGDVRCLQPEQSVAVIGTRQPTDFGRDSGKRLARNFAQQGLIVVSGLAEGCDTAAHIGCLEAGGRAVAVMAHGLHMVYPAANKELAAQIVEAGGCLVSEYPLGQKPFRSSFVERDRLQSGLSSAVVIVQTDIKGGTMHTAKFCLEQRRTLACLNFPVTKRSEKTRGNESLITSGKAVPLWEPGDIEAFLSNVYGNCLQPLVPSIVEVTERTEPQTVKQTQAFEPEQETLPLLLEILLPKDEQAQFLEKCIAQRQTPAEIVTTLIRQFLNPSVASISQLQDEPQVSETVINSEQLVLLKVEHQLPPQQDFSPLESKRTPLPDQTQKGLAARLKVSEKTISKRKLNSDFPSWSKEQDPEGVAWEFSIATKKFQPSF